ncbi:MAG: DUF3611 family protein [Phormidium sp.]
MANKSDSSSVPAAIRQIAGNFRIAGWTSFWLQLVLGVISIIVLLLFIVFSRSPNTNNPNSGNPGTSFGVFLAICGIVSLGIGVYMAFRYVQIGKQLQSSNPSMRPRKAETIPILRMGLIINLVGMLLTILGAWAIVGSLAARSISQVQTAIYADPSRLISSLDILAVQANINTIAGHFAGIIVALWLIDRISR